jgi:hypothetical protein
MNVTGRRLGVPAWQRRFATTLQAREMLRWLRLVELSDDQRRRARAAVRDMYLGRQALVARRRARKLVRMATFR